MNIVFILNGKMTMTPDSGGDRHTIGLAQYCLEQGDHVRIMAPAGTRESSHDSLQNAEWIITENIPLPDTTNIPSVLWKYLKRTIKGSTIDAKPCDLIYCGSILPHEIICAAAWKRKGMAAKLACRSDQIFHHEPFRQKLKYTAHRCASKLGMRLAIKYGDIVIAVNDRIASQWNNALEQRVSKTEVHVLPYGVNQEMTKLRKNVHSYDIAYFARLDHVKGADLIPSVLADLHHNSIKASINIIGDGALKKAIEDQLSQLELAEHVTWQGAIAGSERFEQLSDSKIMLYPTREDGFPMAVVEALAMGVVVVASDNAQLQSAFGDTLIYAESDNTSAMAHKIKQVLESDSMRDDYINKGLEFIRNLPPLGNFENYRSRLQSVISQPHP